MGFYLWAGGSPKSCQVIIPVLILASWDGVHAQVIRTVVFSPFDQLMNFIKVDGFFPT